MLIGALEAGGTKMVCAVGNDKGEILDRISLPTRTPEETMPQMIEYFKGKKVEALGIGCFGPLDLDPASPTFGYIAATPKTAWKFYDITGEFRRQLGVPAVLDTDVNCAVLGEARYGCCRNLSDCVYITVGTGIGMGVLCGGKLLHGMQHPEAGHMLLEPEPGDTFAGCCPYHTHCMEGLASGTAIRERWQAPAQQLGDRPEVWQLEAAYLAKGVMNCILAYAPQRIVLGGGVMHQPGLLAQVREKTVQLLNGYVQTERLHDIENYLVASTLDGNQALLGCLALVMQVPIKTL